MPIIDPKVEELTRDMLGHAIRGEFQELATLVQAVGDEKYRRILALSLTVAGYIAVDVSGRWPTDADVRQIALNAARQETRMELDESEFYDYLSGTALGFQPLEDSLGGPEAAAMLPVLLTGSLLFTFKPQAQKWWEYLDQIWSAYEVADGLDESVIPAVQMRARRTEALKANEAGPGS
jgi:hypothetical protein